MYNILACECLSRIIFVHKGAIIIITQSTIRYKNIVFMQHFVQVNSQAQYLVGEAGASTVVYIDLQKTSKFYTAWEFIKTFSSLHPSAPPPQIINKICAFEYIVFYTSQNLGTQIYKILNTQNCFEMFLDILEVDKYFLIYNILYTSDLCTYVIYLSKPFF